MYSKSTNDDFKTDVVVYSHLGGESLSGNDTERQLVNSKMQNEDTKSPDISSQLFHESSFGDDKEIQTVKSKKLKEDFKSIDPSVGYEANIPADIDSISGYMDDLMKEKLNNNLDPVQNDDQIKDDPICKD